MNSASPVPVEPSHAPPLLNPQPPPAEVAAAPAGTWPAGNDRFGRTYGPMGGAGGVGATVDAVLKQPGRATFELVEGRAGRTAAALAAVAAACLLLYGLVMGSFAGGEQLWRVPLKVLGGTFAAALICLPSLYILVSLAGGTQSLAQTAGLLLQSLTLNALLLLGFAPIAWIFAQATQTTVFMGWLHLTIWLVAVGFSLDLLRRAMAFLNRGRMGRVVGFWGVVFFVVLLQMSTTLRPLVGKGDAFWTGGRLFFLEHWGRCFNNPKP